MRKAFSTNVKVYAIGGALNESLLGTATDGTTGFSLIMYAKECGSKSVSLHGTFCHMQEALSGEVSIDDAAIMFLAADEQMATRWFSDEMRPY